MGRMVKDFIEIRDYTSLDALIDRLVAARAQLAAPAEAEVRLRGDDIWGRQLAIAYSRPQTAEEEASDRRCDEARREARERSRHELQASLQEPRRRLRIVG